MGMPWWFPTSAAQDHPRGLQLPATCGTVGVRDAARDHRRSHHRRFGLHLALRLPDEQVATTAADEVDDFTISNRGMNHTVATVITEAVSSMVGWLESGLVFHVSKDEEGVEQVGGLGLERFAQSVTDFVDEGARREGLARAQPGHRRVRGKGLRGSAERNTDG